VRNNNCMGFGIAMLIDIYMYILCLSNIDWIVIVWYLVDEYQVMKYAAINISMDLFFMN